jgi:hypothetical protein
MWFKSGLFGCYTANSIVSPRGTTCSIMLGMGNVDGLMGKLEGRIWVNSLHGDT